MVLVNYIKIIFKKKFLNINQNKEYIFVNNKVNGKNNKENKNKMEKENKCHTKNENNKDGNKKGNQQFILLDQFIG